MLNKLEEIDNEQKDRQNISNQYQLIDHGNDKQHDNQHLLHDLIQTLLYIH